MILRSQQFSVHTILLKKANQSMQIHADRWCDNRGNKNNLDIFKLNKMSC